MSGQAKMMLGLLLIIAAAGVTARSAAGGDDVTLDCKCAYVPAGEDDWHVFNEIGGHRAYRCGTVGCHEEENPGFCSAEHDGCGASFAATAARLEEVLMSVHSAIQIASRGEVMYNPERHALQVFDCNGLVIGSVRVPQQYLATVIEASMLRFV